VNAWQDVLGALARLDQIALETPPIERFWRRLLALIEERAFRPPAESPRVMVMGWNENCGLEFDHLWIAGMEEDALTPANPHPFLPLRWHRELFGADRAAGEIWARWRRSARDQVVSYSATPHTLLNGVSAAAFGADAAAPPAMPMLVDFEDAPVPLLSGGDMPGGTQFFEAQSACPFRGFAHYRLHARGLPEVPSGRNARQRGTLLHKMLERVYREIPSRELLLSLPEAALGECVRACARTVVDAEGELRERPQLARVEEQRLERQTLDWLEKEKKREPWTAIAWERQENVALGGLRFNIKIDRVDRLPGSGDRLLVIDYKSGEQSMSGWNGERPLHPQLPLYLLASPESSTIEGIALAQLKPGKMQLKSALRGGKAFQMAEWRAALLELARQIEAGEAPVRPKFPRQPICERCDLHTLCRIRERDARWGDTGDEELSDAE
jgi:RecB family exonuclease